jgi:alanine racemase
LDPSIALHAVGNEREPLTPTYAQVHLGHLRHNIRTLRHKAGPAALMGVVKADAYGHGALRVARVLLEEGVTHLAVATVPEALQLRRAGFDVPMLVFAAPLPAYLPAYLEHRLDVAVTSLPLARAVMDAAQAAHPMRVHVKVDTGMGRLGMTPDEFAGVVPQLRRTPGVTVAGLWTHFASASSNPRFTQRQWALFEQCIARVGQEDALIHAASSGAVFTAPSSTGGFERMLARTGIGLYGASANLTEWGGLRPVMRFVSRITHLKTVAPGTPISYEGTWTAPAPSRIATVGAGYADGYPRRLSNRASVGIGGHRYPVVGTVCMDMFMVDLGLPDGPGGAVVTGDEVVLFGEGGPAVYEVAAWSETIPYEICCRVSARVPRRYIDAGTAAE